MRLHPQLAVAVTHLRPMGRQIATYRPPNETIGTRDEKLLHDGNTLPKDRGMTVFREWRKRLGLTQAQAAQALGRSKRSIEMLDRVEQIGRETDFACRWLEQHPEDLSNSDRRSCDI